MKPVKLAVVGAGLIGAKHAELISRHKLCALAGVADRDPARRPVADKLGVPFCLSAEELFDRLRPEGVIVATPTAQHAAAAELCAAHGIHMLIEKPIAEDLAQAERIGDVARAAGVQVLVGHHRRHNPLIRRTRELVRGGDIGALVGVSVLWALRKPDAYFDIAWRRERPGGGPLLINLIHELDSLRFVCGEVAEVFARTSSAIRGFEVEDSLSISLRFESGALGSVLASDATPAAWSYEATTGENPAYFNTGENCCHFLGTQASLAFPRMDLWRYGERPGQGWLDPMERARVEVTPADPLVLQLEHFCRVVRGAEAPVVDARDGAASLAVALAVRESAARHAPV